MSLKSRLKHFEVNMNLREKEPVQEWRERVKRNEEMESLYPDIAQGDLQACIRYCLLCEESIVDEAHDYRDVIVEVAAMKGCYEPSYEDETVVDVIYHNLKATYKYLEEKEKVLNTKEPILKIWDF
ncbi:hypothetical protein [Priestia megaterium]|uniref:hypothetical protein n=1 Tax=Priestia megaterium TaxID=1404 RepID=UPI00345B0010